MEVVCNIYLDLTSCCVVKKRGGQRRKKEEEEEEGVGVKGKEELKKIKTEQELYLVNTSTPQVGV